MGHVPSAPPPADPPMFQMEKQFVLLSDNRNQADKSLVDPGRMGGCGTGGMTPLGSGQDEWVWHQGHGPLSDPGRMGGCGTRDKTSSHIQAGWVGVALGT